MYEQHLQPRLVKPCMCNACVYQRWYKRNLNRRAAGLKPEPRPVKVERDTPCNCRICLISRWRAALRRNKQYLAEIARLTEAFNKVVYSRLTSNSEGPR